MIEASNLVPRAEITIEFETRYGLGAIRQARAASLKQRRDNRARCCRDFSPGSHNLEHVGDGCKALDNLVIIHNRAVGDFVGEQFGRDIQNDAPAFR